MRIRNIETIEFTYESRHAFDEKGHAHPGDPHEATGAITRIAVEGGRTGTVLAAVGKRTPLQRIISLAKIRSIGRHFGTSFIAPSA
ncbi:hypothetical protein ACFQL7_07880 [Halocatena marina]|uniref:Uncharacterized protein n=1 Tax=Halocatena marina TaxID=2934937 RepID=A0ABD5YPM3_9EURY